MKCRRDVALQILRESKVADGVIKLQPSDYNTIPKLDRIMHVNAMPCTHEADRTYAIVPIVGKDETGECLLDIGSPLLVYCEKTMVLQNLKMLAVDSLPSLIGLPSSIHELGDIMFSRYGRTRIWTSESVMSRQIMVSTLCRFSAGQVVGCYEERRSS